MASRERRGTSSHRSSRAAEMSSGNWMVTRMTIHLNADAARSRDPRVQPAVAALEGDALPVRNGRSVTWRSGSARRWSTRPAQLPQAGLSHSCRAPLPSTVQAMLTRAACRDVDRSGTSHLQGSATCAHRAHIGVGSSVPVSVPKLGPRSINRQPTPTKTPKKNGPEIVNFRPVL